MSNTQSGFRGSIIHNSGSHRGSRYGARLVRAKPSIKLPPIYGRKKFPEPSLSSASPSIEPTVMPHRGIGEGRFTDNFVLVKIPAGFLGRDADSQWVPAPRQELYQLEMTRSHVSKRLLKIFLDVAKLELKVIFNKPESVRGYQRIPRVGRNALTFAVLGDSLLGFEVEKDPETINKIMKESLLRVVTRKREVRDPNSCAASDVTEATEKGSVDIFPISCEKPQGTFEERLKARLRG